MNELANCETLTLQDLLLSGFGSLHYTLAQLGHLTPLRTLTLRRFAFDTFSVCPNLSDLRLEGVRCPIQKLSQFIHSSPMLEHVIPEHSVLLDSLCEDPLMVRDRAGLPLLRRLRIYDDKRVVNELDHILPYPSAVLGVVV